MDNQALTTEEANDRRYPRPLWMRIPRWIVNHTIGESIGDIIATILFDLWRPVLFTCLVLYLLGFIYNLAALVVLQNHNNLNVLLIGTNIIHALPFNQVVPALLRYWWVALLSLLGLLVISIMVVFLGLWADEDESNEVLVLKQHRGQPFHLPPDDVRYPRPQWMCIPRWICLNWWLIPAMLLTAYTINTIFSLYSLIVHYGFIDLLNFNYLSSALLFDAFIEHWWIVLSSLTAAAIIIRSLWLWADNDKKQEFQELERRRLLQVEEQEKQYPAGFTLHHTLRWERAKIQHIAWSPDGQMLASGTSFEGIPLWNPETGQFLRTLTTSSYIGSISSIAWSPNGLTLASGQSSRSIELWDVHTGQLVHTLNSPYSHSSSLAWSPDGSALVSVASDRHDIQLWSTQTWELLRTLATGNAPALIRFPRNDISSLAWSPGGLTLAVASPRTDGIQLWDTQTWELAYTLTGHRRGARIAWSPDGETLASTSADRAVLLWDPKTGRQSGSLEGHTAVVLCIAFSCDSRLFASKSSDNTIRLWRTDTWETIAVLNESSNGTFSSSFVGLAFHPKMANVLATLGAEDTVIRIWDLDVAALLSSSPGASLTKTGVMVSTSEPTVGISPPPSYASFEQEKDHQQAMPTQPLVDSSSGSDTAHEPPSVAASPYLSVRYTNAKVILVGDSGVGKSGLSLVLIGQPFAPTESTHGRFVWTFDSQEIYLGGGRKETRETLLWDLAGQPSYRLIHQLHLNEVTVALVIFDARSETDPFAGVYHWDRALRQTRRIQGSSALPMKKFLVAARIDRGGTGVSAERVRSLVNELGFDGFFETSAKEGRNITALAKAIREAINWEALPFIISTELFQQIKAFLVTEKEAGQLLSPADDLYQTFLRSDPALAKIKDLRAQFDTCIGRVETGGLIRRLSFGNLVLLQPEMLDTYTSALVNAVKEEPDGLGSVAEQQARAGNFPIPIEQRLKNKHQEQLLLIAMVEDLLRYEIALREHADDGPYLVFPSQSTRENPDLPNPEGKAVIFSFAGPVLNVYATLAVRLSHSGLFKKQELWRNAVTYTTRLGGTYGIFLQNSGEGQAELTLFFDKSAREETRFHFEEYIAAHLQRYALPESILRRPIFICPTCSMRLDDVQVTYRRQRGYNWMTCGICDTKVSLLDKEERLVVQPSLIQQMNTAADIARDRATAQTVLGGKIVTKDFDVFLCHNGEDKPAVRTIGQQLREQGILPWLDEEQLRPGFPWQRLLEQQIEAIKSAAVFVGGRGRGPWQNMELEAFIREFVRRECPVIPIILTDCKNVPDLPIFLQGMTWVDFRQQDTDPMARLIWGITGERVKVTL